MADTPATPPGFTHHVWAAGGRRLHCVRGGSGPLRVLLPGWPQSWHAWRRLMPALAHQHTVLVIDPPGLGDSTDDADVAQGHDMDTVAALLHALVCDVAAEAAAAEGRPPAPPRIQLLGHDIGAWLAYAYAATWPDEVSHLVVADAAIPGVTPSPPHDFGTTPANLRSWHFGFNQLPDLPELLITGRERAYLRWLIDSKSGPGWRMDESDVDEYTRVLSQPGQLAAGLAYYRALPLSLRQNQQRARLAMPVLALGAEHGVGLGLGDTMSRVADRVTAFSANGCGHYLLEEAPDFVLGHLLDFLDQPP
jgi:pimeloyl-ACP methyl ester carboxylesterase